jgi:hypothetical protein
MRPFTLTIERTRIESARVVVYADSADDAERLGHERAAKDECLWEESEREVRVNAEGPR